MLNRYAIIDSPHSSLNEGWKAVYNAHPTRQLPVFRNMHEVSLMHWGRMAKWSNNKAMSPKLYNIPSAQIFDKPSTKRAIMSMRCIIPTNGFFLWKQLGKKKLSPNFHYKNANKLFGLAGIWETSDDLDGNESLCFLCLVRNEIAQGWPVIIEPEDWKIWLDPDQPQGRIAEIMDKSESLSLNSHPVSPAISNEQNNSPQLIAPINPTDQYGNYTLF